MNKLFKIVVSVVMIIWLICIITFIVMIIKLANFDKCRNQHFIPNYCEKYKDF